MEATSIGIDLKRRSFLDVKWTQCLEAASLAHQGEMVLNDLHERVRDSNPFPIRRPISRPLLVVRRDQRPIRAPTGRADDKCPPGFGAHSPHFSGRFEPYPTLSPGNSLNAHPEAVRSRRSHEPSGTRELSCYRLLSKTLPQNRDPVQSGIRRPLSRGGSPHSTGGHLPGAPLIFFEAACAGVRFADPIVTSPLWRCILWPFGLCCH